MRDISSLKTYPKSFVPRVSISLPPASYSKSLVPRAIRDPEFMFMGAACTASMAQKAMIMEAVEERILAAV
jgi:hypothetical protein